MVADKTSKSRASLIETRCEHTKTKRRRNEKFDFVFSRADGAEELEKRPRGGAVRGDRKTRRSPVLRRFTELFKCAYTTTSVMLGNHGFVGRTCDLLFINSIYRHLH